MTSLAFFNFADNSTAAVVVVFCVLGGIALVDRVLSFWKSHIRVSPNPADVYVRKEEYAEDAKEVANVFVKKDDYHADIAKEKVEAAERRRDIHNKIDTEGKRLDAKIESATAQMRAETKGDTDALHKRIDEVNDALRKDIAQIPASTIALLKNTGAINSNRRSKQS